MPKTCAPYFIGSQTPSLQGQKELLFSTNSSQGFEVDPFPSKKGSLKAKSFQTCGLNSHLQEVFLENFQFFGKLFQRIWSWMPPLMMGFPLHCWTLFLALALAFVE